MNKDISEKNSLDMENNNNLQENEEKKNIEQKCDDMNLDNISPKNLNKKRKRENIENQNKNDNLENKKILINENNLNSEIKEINKINSNPIDIKFLTNLTEDSYAGNYLDHTFNVFKSFDDVLYLIYSNKYNSIISYNLIDNKKINEIKNAHYSRISNFRYFLDKTNKRDLILSVSCRDNNTKLWNIQNLECLLNIDNRNEDDILLSSCFFNYKNQNYIITNNSSIPFNFEIIKIFDFNGIKIKQIVECNYPTNIIESYYDNKNCLSYIITGYNGFVKSYDYSKNKVYKIYSDENYNEGHSSIIINDKEDTIKLIGSSYDGNIRVWDFHSGKLLIKIMASSNKIHGICLWDNEYLFVGDETMKLIDIKEGIIINDLVGHNSLVLTIKKIIIPKYGECLISQSKSDNQIKLWNIKANQ